MAVFIQEANGYIIDNPNIDFLRCDGKVFSYDEVNTAQWSNTNNSVTINGGWSSFPLAYIDTDKTQEITYSSSQFDLAMFEMANATNAEEGDFGTLETERFDVVVADSTTSITMPFEVQAGSVKIRGMEETSDTVATGKFKVAITASTAETAGSTVVTFYTGDYLAGDVVRASYRRRVIGASAVSVTSTGTTAKGELSIHWPVYSSGTDCTESSVKGYLHANIYRVRVTAAPGFDNSLMSGLIAA